MRFSCSLIFVLAGLLSTSVACAEWLEDVYWYGDVRLRGYYSDPSLNEVPDSGQQDYSGDSRLRLSANIPLTDSITALGTLRWVTGLDPWSQNTEEKGVAGAYVWSWDHFDFGRTELSWNNILFSDGSLRVGRSVLQFDDGLLFSAVDDAWLIDRVEAAYDRPSLRLSAIYGEVTHLAPNTPIHEFVFVHGGTHQSRTFLSENSLYGGAFRMDDDGQPLLGGLRSVLYKSSSWNVSAEVAGQAGTRQHEKSLLAMISDGRLSYTWNHQQPDDGVQLRWTFASGDQQAGGSHSFIPLFNYEEWGCVFSPRLSNIHIVSLKSSMAIIGRVRAGLGAFLYRQAHTIVDHASVGNFNNGGYLHETNGEESELGSELDAFLRYMIQDGFCVEVSGGYFFRGSAYRNVPHAQNASEIRVQLFAEF